MENYLLFREPNSNRFFGADLGSVTDYEALQFANADSSPDDMVGMITDHRALLCFGDTTTEIFENTGAAGFPFERNINGTMQVGLADASLVGRIFDIVYFVADDLTVRRLEGNQPVRISTHFVEQKLASFTIASGETWAYQSEGHFFIGFTFLEGTLVYDAVTQEWHERESYREKYWRPRWCVEFAGKILAGDPFSNNVIEVDKDTYSDVITDRLMSSTIQRMEWTYQPIYAEQTRAFHNRLEIVIESGVSLTTGQGSNAKLMVEYSDDGGRVWKKLPDRSIGGRGEYEARVVWHNLGSARKRVYRAAVSDPIPVTVIDTVIEVNGGRL